jgi:DHA2 family lincomycin resistance protein-like MFS transporter
MLATIGADTPVAWLLAAYVVLCVGLAVTFTPLMTAGLGSVRPALYAHGSAVLGTFQQVAGAAGTALFVTVMTIVSTRSAEDGATTEVAVADGVQSAFLVGACVSLLLLVVVTFVRKPEPEPGADGAPLPH